MAKILQMIHSSTHIFKFVSGYNINKKISTDDIDKIRNFMPMEYNIDIFRFF